MQIEKLTYVNVRDIWRHEAKDFTQWLANNIDYLNDKLGFTVNVMETERQVGSFSVDIYGEDEQGNSVIIENQLEKTDHTHLGQILTYAVGVDAKTIIWVSPEPRTEHVEVIHWLNEVTPLDMRWYLFKLEAVKIGESAVSPLFSQIAGPSQEIKTLGSEKKVIAERHHQRVEFWANLLAVLNEKTHIFRNISPTHDNWISGSTGFSGFYHNIIIRKNSASIQLVVEKNGNTQLNKKMFDALHEHKQEIEAAFGLPLNWRRMDEQISSRIQYDLATLGLEDRSTWTEGMKDIAERFMLWDGIFKERIKALV